MQGDKDVHKADAKWEGLLVGQKARFHIYFVRQSLDIKSLYLLKLHFLWKNETMKNHVRFFSIFNVATNKIQVNNK